MVKLFGGKNVVVSAKSRAIIFFTVVILIVTIAVAYLWYKRHREGLPTGAGLTRAPGIESIPGGGQATTEYVRIQEQQNIREAEQAAAGGTSAVPTITRVSYFGPSEFQAPGQPSKPGCSPDELRRARAAGVKAEELRCKGCSLADLRAAGYTAGELAAAEAGANELKNAGFTPAELKQAGFSAAELKRAGFSPSDLANAGYSPGDLAQAGFSPTDLQNAGLSPAALAAAGIGLKPSANLPKDCNIDSLRRARAQGVSAVELKKLGCGAAALRAAGYSAGDLRAAGFTPSELQAAGFSPKELADAGFSPGELRRAGLSANDLKNAGFGPSALRGAGFGADALKNAGFSPDQLKAAGYTDGDLLRAGVTPPSGVRVTPVANCSVEALREARARGVSARELRDQGCSAAALRAAGYTAADLKGAGFNDDDLRRAGFSPAEIAAAAGVTAQPPGILGAAVVPPVSSSEIELAKLQAKQEQQLNAQQRADKLAQVTASMATQANSLFSTWTPPPTQQYVAGESQDKDKNKQVVTAVPPGTPIAGVVPVAPVAAVVPPVAGGVVTGGPQEPPKCADVKAGDIMFGVLTSAVNSDENSPVMATIVSGKLKGGKLVGQFSLLKERVILNFSKLNIPTAATSIPISAVAVDPKTAHTALADCVDRHLLLRYGSLFASSFLSGLADAISQSGSQVSTGSGGILVTHDALNTGEKIAVALGAVGSQYASVLGSNFTRPPTVIVCAGTSIGVLFMQDLVLPPPCVPP